MLALTGIAQIIEQVLNRPFPRGVAPKRFDIHQDCQDLFEIGRKVTQGDSEVLQLFKEECAEGLIGMFSPDHKPSLRVSKLGSEPLLQALSVLGYEVSDPLEDPFIPMGGHVYEAWVRFLLRSRGFNVVYNAYSGNSLEYMGVRGHYDFILETGLGRRIVCEVKHVSESYINSILEPERIESSKTGKLIKTGRNLSQLSEYAYLNDTRGYLTQISVYMEALNMEGLLILWDKKRNLTHVVPVHEDVKQRALKRCREIIPALKEVSTLEDVFEQFEIPEPTPQYAKGSPTGNFYVPFSIRYCSQGLKEALFPLEVDRSGQEWVVGGKARSLSEILKVGLDNGYFNPLHLRHQAPMAA